VGSCYPDAPDIFLSEEQLAKIWGTGERKWLFAQDVQQGKAEQLLLAVSIPSSRSQTDAVDRQTSE